VPNTPAGPSWPDTKRVQHPGFGRDGIAMGVFAWERGVQLSVSLLRASAWRRWPLVHTMQLLDKGPYLWGPP
jgi:hypothetical protein